MPTSPTTGRGRLTSWWLTARPAILGLIFLSVGGGLAGQGSADPVDVPKTNPTKLYMHYMPWFDTPYTLGSNNWGIHWTMANQNPNVILSNGQRQIASHYYPLIGPYASVDPDVIEYHLLLMKYAGVDGVLIDWYGVQGTNGDIVSLLNNSNALINQVDDFGIDFGVVMEDRFSANIGQAEANVAYLRDNYFNNPQYIRQGAGNDPLMLVFGPITFQSESQWDQILDDAGEDVDFVTLWFESGDAGANSDGEYAWPYEDAGQDNYLAHLQNFYQNRIPQLNGQGKDAAGGYALPGFNDFYSEGGWGSGLPWDIPHDGQTLGDSLALADTYSNTYDFLQLTTWNDFGEGTMFEPTVEFGFDYLLELQQFSGTPYDETELQLVLDLYLARKAFAGNGAAQAVLDDVSELLAALEPNAARATLQFLVQPGDVDLDGDVDLEDYNIMSGNMYGSGLAYGDGDLNGDGFVNFEDFVLLALHMGESAAENIDSLPEPATLSVLMLGAILLRTRRRSNRRSS